MGRPFEVTLSDLWGLIVVGYKECDCDLSVSIIGGSRIILVYSGIVRRTASTSSPFAR